MYIQWHLICLCNVPCLACWRHSLLLPQSYPWIVKSADLSSPLSKTEHKITLKCISFQIIVTLLNERWNIGSPCPSVRPNFVSIVSDLNRWIDFKDGVWFYMDRAYIVSDFSCCPILNSCISGACYARKRAKFHVNNELIVPITCMFIFSTTVL